MGSTTFSRRSQTSVGNFTPCTEWRQASGISAFRDCIKEKSEKTNVSLERIPFMYERIFRAVRDAIIAAGGPEDIRIVLDFEKAAINAARRCFPSASTEGCAFHAHGTNKEMILGCSRRRIESWWNTIKGLIFLPPHLHRRVPARFQPPVPRGHGAYGFCAQFLDYLQRNWYEGPFRTCGTNGTRKVSAPLM
ncbi:hypothetical protein COOONC_23756 [Cooperia oncophora]